MVAIGFTFRNLGERERERAFNKNSSSMIRTIVKDKFEEREKGEKVGAALTSRGRFGIRNVFDALDRRCNFTRFVRLIGDQSGIPGLHVKHRVHEWKVCVSVDRVTRIAA